MVIIGEMRINSIGFRQGAQIGAAGAGIDDGFVILRWGMDSHFLRRANPGRALSFQFCFLLFRAPTEVLNGFAN